MYSTLKQILYPAANEVQSFFTIERIRIYVPILAIFFVATSVHGHNSMGISHLPDILYLIEDMFIWYHTIQNLAQFSFSHLIFQIHSGWFLIVK